MGFHHQVRVTKSEVGGLEAETPSPGTPPFENCSRLRVLLSKLLLQLNGIMCHPGKGAATRVPLEAATPPLPAAPHPPAGSIRPGSRDLP